MKFKNRDIVSIKDFSKPEIAYLLDYAKKMIPYAKGEKHTAVLDGKILSSLFFLECEDNIIKEKIKELKRLKKI